MKYNQDIHHRRSIRLRDYDYSTAGAYFVTIYTFERECLLGDVVNGEMRLNDMGRIIDESWRQITNHFSGVYIDQFVVMPNHFHGIITTVGAGFPRPYNPIRHLVCRVGSAFHGSSGQGCFG